MDQIAVIYVDSNKDLIAVLEFNDIITNCDIKKVPGVNVVISKRVDNLFFIEDNKWKVNENLLFSQIE